MPKNIPDGTLLKRKVPVLVHDPNQPKRNKGLHLHGYAQASKHLPEDGITMTDAKIYLFCPLNFPPITYDLYLFDEKIGHSYSAELSHGDTHGDTNTSLRLFARIDFSSVEGQKTLTHMKELLLVEFKEENTQKYIREYFEDLHKDKRLVGVWYTGEEANDIVAFVLFTIPPDGDSMIYLHWWCRNRTRDEGRGLGKYVLNLVGAMQLQMHNNIKILSMVDNDEKDLIEYYKRGGFTQPNPSDTNHVAKIWKDEYDNSEFLTPLILEGKFFMGEDVLSYEQIKNLVLSEGRRAFSNLILKNVQMNTKKKKKKKKKKKEKKEKKEKKKKEKKETAKKKNSI